MTFGITVEAEFSVQKVRQPGWMLIINYNNTVESLSHIKKAYLHTNTE